MNRHKTKLAASQAWREASSKRREVQHAVQHKSTRQLVTRGRGVGAHSRVLKVYVVVPPCALKPMNGEDRAHAVM